MDIFKTVIAGAGAIAASANVLCGATISHPKVEFMELPQLYRPEVFDFVSVEVDFSVFEVAIEEPVIAIVEEVVSYYVPSEGGRLTPQAGVYNGPSGKETYYNLDMSGVVRNAYAAGVSGEYWVREDGAKMLGDFIICACSEARRYSTLETSMGTGICLDTGGFAYSNPMQIDIAVTW